VSTTSLRLRPSEENSIPAEMHEVQNPMAGVARVHLGLRLVDVNKQPRNAGWQARCIGVSNERKERLQRWQNQGIGKLCRVQPMQSPRQEQ